MATKRRVDSSEEHSDGRRAGRRAVIAAASGIVAAALARASASSDVALAAADANDFLLNTVNTASATTELDRAGGGSEPALTVRKAGRDQAAVSILGQSGGNTTSGEVARAGVGVLGKLGTPDLSFDGMYYLTIDSGVLGFAQLPIAIPGAASLNVTATAAVVGASTFGGGVLAVGPGPIGILGTAGPSTDLAPQLLTLTAAAGQGPAESIATDYGGAAINYAGQAGVIFRRRKLPGRMKSGTLINWGDGVLGVSAKKSGYGVDAIHAADGVALGVDGRAQFSTYGKGVVKGVSTASGGSADVTVTNPDARKHSHVTVTLEGDPVRPVYVTWVQRAPHKGLTIHFNQVPAVDTPFSYWIVESEGPAPTA